MRTFRLTSDNNLDENPQITTAEFGDGEERFVVAWHTERAITEPTPTFSACFGQASWSCTPPSTVRSW